MERMMLTAEQILTAPDLEERIVDVPQWGGSVRIKAFSKAEQLEMRKAATIGGKIDVDRVEVLMFIHGVIDPQFSEDQYEQLRQKSAGAIDLVLQAILEASGLTKEAMRQAEKQFRD